MEVAIFSLAGNYTTEYVESKKWLLEKCSQNLADIEAFFIAARAFFLTTLALSNHFYMANTVIVQIPVLRYLVEGITFGTLAILTLTVFPVSAVRWDREKTLKFSGLLFAMYVIFYPLKVVAKVIFNLILKKLGLEGLQSIATQRQLAYIADDSGAHLEDEERLMIRHIVDFVGTTVREVMVPRIDMICAPVQSNPQQIISIIQQYGHSRIPLFREKIDNIVGILYAKDLLLAMGENVDNINLARICRKPYFVPEAKLINELLAEFRREKLHFAVVVDEFGGVAGIVTMEDLLEEIVGEIQDEYDMEEELVVKLDQGVWRVAGKLPIDEVMEYTGLQLPEDAADTIGGLIYQLAGAIPNPGFKVELEDYNLILIVDSIDAQRITTVKIIDKQKQA